MTSAPSILETRLTPTDQAFIASLHGTRTPSAAEELPLAATAYLALASWNAFGRPIILVTEGPMTQDKLYQDLLTLSDSEQLELLLFPARETLPGKSALPSPDLVGLRLAALQRMLKDPFPPIIVTSIQALLQRTLKPASLAGQLTSMPLGTTMDPDDLGTMLVDRGYDFQLEVQSKGQASRRGGILDLWPPSQDWPVRLEFFGNVLDSIRTFDPVEQRSQERLQEISIGPAGELREGITSSSLSLLTDYLPEHLSWIWVDPADIAGHAHRLHESFTGKGKNPIPEFEELRTAIAAGFSGGQLETGFAAREKTEAHRFSLDFTPAISASHSEAPILDQAEQQRRDMLQQMNELLSGGWQIHVYLSTEGSCERFRETWHEQFGKKAAAPTLHAGVLSAGFMDPVHRLMVTCEADLYGRQADTRGHLYRGTKRRLASQLAGQRVAEWSDLQPGDHVVHLEHGIGKYLGLYEIKFDNDPQEALAVEYAEGARLYVPISQAHLLSRYIGLGKKTPRLHMLGSRKWRKEKELAEEAVQDLAAHLLETQAARASEPGFAFPPDTAWQHEFEAAFPYVETPDQERAIQEIKDDMEQPRPMDRLVCGDVGYGKTEVAMRAAFKVVTNGRQVLMLVPTTILAQQHFETFSDRMKAFPVRIEMLSRFQTKQQQRAVVERIRDGKTDIVIGTHRLIQRDVRPKNLGLLIIDEEQRFGVEQKEFLKRLRTSVDILTLTATPIPRTLYMSLTGARDMSTIQTPPQERLPIETIVAENRDEIIREAILRELNRDGQVFFLHNRVQTIEKVRDRIRRLVPEAKVLTAHGQMAEKELERVMHAFIRREFDVLVCTTIIESGVDIPNVNTILIDRADRFGLSGLYQLRGRVGRFRHKAYAYLLIPKHGHIYDTARKRISAIRKYSSLGAGFKLALQDLEIRGAGNILGAEQSGHIATVGFDLYCQLLKRAVAIQKGEEVPPLVDTEIRFDFIDQSPAHADEDSAAAIPHTYMEDENQRVLLYRKIACASWEKELDDLEEELRDRFGPVPAALHRLLLITRIRVLCAARNIKRIETQGEKVMMTRRNEYIRYDRKFPRTRSTFSTGRLEDIIEIVRQVGKEGRLPGNIDRKVVST